MGWRRVISDKAHMRNNGAIQLGEGERGVSASDIY
jgi:hypothetical protein